MRAYTVAFSSVYAREVVVEAHFAPGLPNFFIVGLANKAVAESRERIRAAFHAMGISLPGKRLIVNLAPADIQKEGSHYDLPIALSILSALQMIDPIELQEYTILGEMALDGRVNRIAGVLPAAVHAAEMGRGIICPRECGQEATWAGPIKTLAIHHVVELLNHMSGRQVIPPMVQPEIAPDPSRSACERYGDMSDIKGQHQAKRGLEVAACGGHHTLMMGPPGAGKSMLAQRLPTILPPLTPEEALDVTMIYSVAGMVPETGLMVDRPYRDPHHSASIPAMVGGGQRVKPGEISLAHHGVLFLDELPEFQRSALEALRQPLELGTVTIARAQEHVAYPARIQLVAAMNPCPCGYLGEAPRECSKAPRCGSLYQERLSGPLFDRFDLSFHVPAVPPHELMSADKVEGESSQTIALRVQNARQRQYDRQGKLNCMLTTSELQTLWDTTPMIHKILEQAAQKWQLSARGYHRLLRVSQSIADLNQSPDIRPEHVHEALTFRMNRHTTS